LLDSDAGEPVTKNILAFLAKASFQVGLIGIDEYDERLRVAQWLYDKHGHWSDPRLPVGLEDRREEQEFDTASGRDDGGGVRSPVSDPVEIEFYYQGWIFTKADPDPYPSTPHGHWRSQNQKWPKLDPYRGRVFQAKHQEDVTRRLSKKEMKKLWNDGRFCDFCRDHIRWYMEQYPHHAFRVRDPFRFPRW
jgi:hypothetical protein